LLDEFHIATHTYNAAALPWTVAQLEEDFLDGYRTGTEEGKEVLHQKLSLYMWIPLGHIPSMFVVDSPEKGERAKLLAHLPVSATGLVSVKSDKKQR